MQQSLFTEIVEKYFRLVIGKITEKFNGQSAEPTLLHKTMLAEEYSPDLNWGSTEIGNSIVAADVVALDSPLPLKKRGKINNASGSVTKLGVKFRKGERDILNLRTMIARGADEATVASKVFDDAPKAVKSIDVRTEIMFQQALSTGVVLVGDASDDPTDNNGTGVRVDFGYNADNGFNATVAPWGKRAARPLDDIQQLFDKANADSNAIKHVFLSKKYFNLLRNSQQAKLLTATYEGQAVVAAAVLPVPSRKSFMEALEDEFGATFHIVDSVFKVEKPDGSTVPVTPWAEGNIVGVPAEQVGRLVYSTLAEEDVPAANVSYEKSGSHILVSKYSQNEPTIEEITAATALCMPVIDGADSIYLLHADEAPEDTIEPADSELSFGKAAATKSVAISYTGDAAALTAEASADWLTVSLNDGTLKVKAAANSEASAQERTGMVIISDGYNEAAISVTQAANT